MDDPGRLCIGPDTTPQQVRDEIARENHRAKRQRVLSREHTMTHDRLDCLVAYLLVIEMLDGIEHPAV